MALSIVFNSEICSLFLEKASEVICSICFFSVEVSLLVTSVAICFTMVSSRGIEMVIRWVTKMLRIFHLGPILKVLVA